MSQLTFEQVPTLDLSRFNTDRVALVSEVGQAFRQFGFCCFSNHGIPDHLVAEAYETYKRFFDLPPAEKMRYRAKPGGARGYIPFKVETAKDQKIPDLKEFLHIGRDPLPGAPHLAPNIWPDEIADFQDRSLALYRSFDDCAARILQLMAMNLGLDDDYFVDVVRGGDHILRVLHYPPVDPTDLPAVRAAAHEDIDLITLLVGATSAGLELLTKEGQWLPIIARENTLVVNAGDMLQRLTNHQYRSTTHRVVNPELAPGEKTVARFSMPFFVHPRPDFVIETLPQTITPDRPNQYPEPTTAREYLDERLAEIKLR
jgi:isopenicillin N synthase-like dioxygenase